MKLFSSLITTIAAAAVCLCLPVTADGAFLSEYESVIYNQESGLDSASANAVVQTSDGYIMIGTYTGLYRYDGRNFTLTDNDKGINNVRTLFIDSKDRMWTGTNDNGVAIYNNDSIDFLNKSSGISSDSIRCFCEGTDGSIYIGSTGALNAVTPSGTVKEYTEVSYVNSLCTSADGTVAGVTNDGTIFFIFPDGKIAKDTNTSNPDEYFSCICAMSDGSFIAGSSGNDVYRCTIENGTPAVSKYATLDGISGMAEIKEDSDGSVIVCCDNGIIRITGTLNTETISNESFNSNITGMIKDYQDNYWFVSSRQGIMKLTENPFVSIGGNGVANAVEIHNGLIYTGCDDGLKINSAVSDRAIENDLTKMLDGSRIRHIMEDSSDRLWISTYGTEGLICYTPSDGSMINYTESDSGTLGSRFRFSFELSDKTVLAASPNGLSYIKDGVVTDTISTDEGLTMPQILCAVEMPDGTILAGSDGDGIYGIKDGKIEFNIGKAQGLDSLVIMRIVPYKEQYLLVTGNALYLLDSSLSAKKLSSFTYSNNFDIIRDSSEEILWITSSAGIFCVDGDALINDRCGEHLLFNYRNGLNTSLTANSWNYTDDGNNIYLCCSDGVRKFSSDALRQNDVSFRLRLNTVTLGDGTRIPMQAAEGYDGKFEIPAEASRLSFSPAALNFTMSDPEISLYLDGFDELPLKMHQSELNDISFTNLPHGSYYFRISSGEESSVYLVEKAARFYETQQFKTYLLTVGIAAVAFITWIITKIASLNFVKRQYEEVRTAKEEADRANNAKSMFLANISHEIRTPINTMLGMNEMILRENKDADIEKYAVNIKNAGNTLISIVNDILDISRIESGGMNIIPEKYDLIPMIKSLVSMFEYKASEKKLIFTADIAPDIPRFLYGDELRIRQIITNLLSNAVKYTEKGSITLKIRCEKPDSENILLAVTVQDTGIGIKDEDKERVFNNFERLEEHINKGIEGTGLGLSITSRLLRLMDSKLEFISEYGSGSAFGFSLKQKIMSEETVGKITFSESTTSDDRYHYTVSFTAPDARILVVDDNPMNLAVMQGLLKSTLIKTDSAQSGKECLELIAKQHYDIIFLDHMMPDMDGIATLKEIRSTSHLCGETPVIALTANAVSDAKNIYLAHGFSDYISKPVDSAILEELIIRYLPNRLISGAEAVEPTNNSTGLVSTDNIDVSIGLKYSDNSEELYRSILDIYINSSGNTVKKLINAFEAEDIKNYEIIVHSIKSTSLGIGAEKLSALAQSLEFAARDGRTDFIISHHPILIESYNSVISDLKNML